ncbi:MAG TPA: dTDP-4-amino-4,6-dideoxygalactose transaminase [Ignavibacteriales bacterium]|nr:dTDP-4-amino-4,6-dideoxygalactose transaminase [Ignavibacteriales bacterium]
MIPFNLPTVTGNELKYIQQCLASKQISGEGDFTKKCQNWFEEKLQCKRALLTPSCTHALEMAAILIDTKPGDEIIMPSYTFVSTANAFAMRGATIVFVDIRPDTLNINENLIEAAISPKTKAICIVHYAGIACEMNKILQIANKYNLYVIEDSAQGILSKYSDKYLGTIGHFGCISFHETKNITSGGEGGLLIINDEKFIERAEIIREKGTDRSKFFRGLVDKYTWVDIGSSYLLNELSAAYLWGQLEISDKIIENRKIAWGKYYLGLKKLYDHGIIELPVIPTNCKNNYHLFYIKTKDLTERTNLLQYLRDNGIYAVFHYVPLHTSPAGLKYGKFSSKDIFTTKESEKLIRLPLFYGIKDDDINFIIEKIYNFYKL